VDVCGSPQYVYFCTSTASKLMQFVLVKQVTLLAVDVCGSPQACGWSPQYVYFCTSKGSKLMQFDVCGSSQASVSPWRASPLPATPLSSYLSASHMRYISEAVANVQRAVNSSLAVNTLLSTPAPQVLSLLAWYQEEEYCCSIANCYSRIANCSLALPTAR
jgi:hypothetical protein